MLQGYSATIKNNHVYWLDTPPTIDEDDEVVIMVLPKMRQITNETAVDNMIKRHPPKSLKGLGRETGDIVNVPEFETMWEINDDIDYS